MKYLQTIGVIGAGTMGTGIAQVCALSGVSVPMRDVDEQRVAHGHDAAAGGLQRLVKKAKLSAAGRDFNDPKYRPAPLLKEMVTAGHLGRKSGRGFCTYT